MASVKIGYLNLLRASERCRFDVTRRLRRIASSSPPTASKFGQEAKSDARRSPIIIEHESLDLSLASASVAATSSSSSLAADLSTTARLAIESEPELMRRAGGASLLDEHGKIQLKRVKFAFDADLELKKLNDLLKHQQQQHQKQQQQQQQQHPKQDNQLDHQNDVQTLRDIILKKRNPASSDSTIPLVETTATTTPLLAEEDPTHPKSSKVCGGCGAPLHCQNKRIEGFIPAPRFKTLANSELRYTTCQRCDMLTTRNKLINVDTSLCSSFDYDRHVIGELIGGQRGVVHIVLLVDLLDIPNSIYEGWSKLRTKPGQQLDIILVGNKFDLLPSTGRKYRDDVVECLLKHCADKGIHGPQIKHVELISAKTGWRVETLITKMFELWNDEGNVYLLGMANAGKSMLFNQLLDSDYCRTLAGQAMRRATTSGWPGTTINMLKFPIQFLATDKSSMRSARLANDKARIEQLDEQRSKEYKKTNKLELTECFGIVGSTFSPLASIGEDVSVNVDSTYSLDEFTGTIVSGETFVDTNDIKHKQREEARSIYNPKHYEQKSTWFYDTPGVLGNQELLRSFSKDELKITQARNVIMPRVYWMLPGQTLFVAGLIRIDLLESTNGERVLFSIMSSPALPIISPVATRDAESTFQSLSQQGAMLRVPYKDHIRETPLPPLEPRDFEIECVGNYKSTADIVFSCFGWAAVSSRPETKATVRAYTLGGQGLCLRTPSLLPSVVNLRKLWSRQDQSQSFKTITYNRPTLIY